MKPEPEQPREPRLPYEKPVLQSISLVADQVLGTSCKVSESSSGQGIIGGCRVILMGCYNSYGS